MVSGTTNICATAPQISTKDTWHVVQATWIVMAQAQKPNFVFRPNGRVHLNRPVGVSSVDYRQPRCAASAVVMLDTPCSEVVWRVLTTHCIRQFPLHFPSLGSPCAITFQLESIWTKRLLVTRNWMLAVLRGPDVFFCPRRYFRCVVLLFTNNYVLSCLWRFLFW